MSPVKRRRDVRAKSFQEREAFLGEHGPRWRDDVVETSRVSDTTSEVSLDEHGIGTTNRVACLVQTKELIAPFV